MIEDKTLIAIKGGAFSFNATFLNALARGINTLVDIGRSLGTSIRMLVSGSRC